MARSDSSRAGRGPALARRQALLLAAAVAASWRQVAAAPEAKLDVVELAPGVFAHQGVHELPNAGNLGAIANGGFVIGEEAVAVIDSGSAASGAALHEALRARTDRPVRYVIATHVHPDHMLGQAAFLADRPRFVGHAQLAQALAERGDFYLQQARAQIGMAGEAGQVVPPDLLVEDRLELDLGGRTLALTAWPTAHTDADLTVYDPASSILWTGDLVFMERCPSLDGSLLGWLDALDRLAALPARRVVPGHGPLGAAWPAAAMPLRRYLEALRDGVRAALAANRSIEQTIATVARDQAEDWRLFADYHGFNVTAAYAELEWE